MLRVSRFLKPASPRRQNQVMHSASMQSTGKIHSHFLHGLQPVESQLLLKSLAPEYRAKHRDGYLKTGSGCIAAANWHLVPHFCHRSIHNESKDLSGKFHARHHLSKEPCQSPRHREDNKLLICRSRKAYCPFRVSEGKSTPNMTGTSIATDRLAYGDQPSKQLVLVISISVA